MKEKLKEEVMNVSLIGGLIRNDNFFSRVLIKKVNNSFKDINIMEPDFPPAMGAVMIAKKREFNG